MLSGSVDQFDRILAGVDPSLHAQATENATRCRNHPEDMWKDKRCAAHAKSGTHVGDPLSLDGDASVSDTDEAEYLELTGSGSGSGTGDTEVH